MHSRDRKIAFGAILTLIIFGSCAKQGVQTTFSRLKTNIDLQVEQQDRDLISQKPFEGVEAIISKCRQQPQDTVKVAILLVHGVREKRLDHWQVLRRYIRDSLSWDQLSSQMHDFQFMSPEDDQLGALPWTLTETVYAAQPGDSIQILEVFWSPITTGIKKFINTYDHSLYRTGVAQWLKKELFLDAFVDFALYSNDAYREMMMATIDSTFEKVSTENQETIVIGGGLGGQLLMKWMEKEDQLSDLLLQGDMLAQLDPGEVVRSFEAIATAQSQRFIQEYRQDPVNIQSQLDRSFEDMVGKVEHQLNIRNIFLISNQIPFTTLFTLEADEIHKVLNEEDEYTRYQLLDSLMYQDFLRYIEFGKKLQGAPLPAGKTNGLRVVSFFDPNDPFGFYLPNDWQQDNGLEIINVKRQTAAVWEFNSHEALKTLKSIPLVNFDEALYSLIDETQAKQHLQLRVDGAQEDSRGDDLVLHSIFKGIDERSRRVQIAPDVFPNEPDLMRHSGKYKPKKRQKKLIGGGFIRTLHQLVAFTKFGFGSAVQPFENASVDIENKILGISTSLTEGSLTQIVTIHGMRSKPPNHFDQMMYSLVRELGFYETPVSDEVQFVEENHPARDSSSLRTVVFQNQNNQKLAFHIMYWSPLTYAMKDWLKDRAKLDKGSVATSLLKREIITDGLGDVALTLNGQLETFRALTHMAIRNVAKQKESLGKGTSNNYVISGSLGSWLLFDYVRDYSDSAWVKAMFGETKEWYLLTNQLSLIGLTELPQTRPTTDYQRWVIDAARESGWFNSYQTKLVAFNDPNDILSFKLPEPGPLDLLTDEDRVVNVYLNTANGFRVNMNQMVRYAQWIDEILINESDSIKRESVEATQALQAQACQTFVASSFGLGDSIFKPAACRFIDKESAEKYYETTLERCDNKHDLIEQQVEENGNPTNADMLAILNDQGYKYDLVEPKCKHHLMKKKNFMRLSEPGLIMSALRSIATGEAQQEFVVDFATAHEGPKANKVVLKIIAHGSDDPSVRKTFRPQPK